MDGPLILRADFLSLFPLFHSLLFPIISTIILLCPPSLSPPPPLPLFLFLIHVIVLEMISSSDNDLTFFVSTSLRRPVAEGQGSAASSLPTSIVVSLPTAPPPPPPLPAQARPNNSLSNRKPGVLPANLEEMKVFGNPFVPANPSPS